MLKSGDPLVAGDPRRKAAADSGGVVWTRFSASASAGASLGQTVSANASASFGLSSGAEVTAIVAAEKSLSARNIAGTVKEQGETLALALD
ncbi:MAG: hypothetical protein ACYC8T_32925, partial [Myxococcaceae bacterium]